MNRKHKIQWSKNNKQQITVIQVNILIVTELIIFLQMKHTDKEKNMYTYFYFGEFILKERKWFNPQPQKQEGPEGPKTLT